MELVGYALEGLVLVMLVANVLYAMAEVSRWIKSKIVSPKKTGSRIAKYIDLSQER